MTTWTCSLLTIRTKMLRTEGRIRDIKIRIIVFIRKPSNHLLRRINLFLSLINIHTKLRHFSQYLDHILLQSIHPLILYCHSIINPIHRNRKILFGNIGSF